MKIRFGGGFLGMRLAQFHSYMRNLYAAGALLGMKADMMTLESTGP